MLNYNNRKFITSQYLGDVLVLQVSVSDAKQVTLLSVGRPLTGVFQCEVSADAPLFQTQMMAAPMTVAGKTALSFELFY